MLSKQFKFRIRQFCSNLILLRKENSVEISAVEIFGYCASALIAFSLTRSSIIKLRWFNLFGASSFCTYGILIGSYPVAILNGFIAVTNVFFLYRMLLHTEQNFVVIEVSRPSNYVDFFLEAHQAEIEHFFPRFFKTYHDKQRDYFFLTEHTNVVGVLSGYRQANNDFVVDFDFVIPEYRDFKLGHFVMGAGKELKKKFKFNDVVAKADSVEHEHYLISLGFEPGKKGIWSYSG